MVVSFMCLSDVPVTLGGGGGIADVLLSPVSDIFLTTKAAHSIPFGRKLYNTRQILVCVLNQAVKGAMKGGHCSISLEMQQRLNTSVSYCTC